MTATFDEMRDDFARAFEAIQEANVAQTRMLTMLSEQNVKLWVAVEDLRGNLDDVAERLDAAVRLGMHHERRLNERVLPRSRALTGTPVPVTAEGRGVAQQARTADVSRRREPSAAPTLCPHGISFAPGLPVEGGKSQWCGECYPEEAEDDA